MSAIAQTEKLPEFYKLPFLNSLHINFQKNVIHIKANGKMKSMWKYEEGRYPCRRVEIGNLKFGKYLYNER
jgi:hypothetical protein